MTDRIESRGVEPLLNFLRDSVGAFPLLSNNSWNADNFDWFATIKRTRQYSAAIFLAFAVARDSDHPKKNLIQFMQAGLSLGLRKHYFANASTAMRTIFQVYMKNLTLLMRESAGFSDSLETTATVMADLEDVFTFETQLAEVR